MSTPQDIPSGKHHAPDMPPADEIGTGEPGNGAGHHGAPPLIRLTNAGKRYGAVIALSEITMEVGAGEVTVDVAPNPDESGFTTEAHDVEVDAAGRIWIVGPTRGNGGGYRGGP